MQIYPISVYIFFMIEEWLDKPIENNTNNDLADYFFLSSNWFLREKSAMIFRFQGFLHSSDKTIEKGPARSEKKNEKKSIRYYFHMIVFKA